VKGDKTGVHRGEKRGRAAWEERKEYNKWGEKGFVGAPTFGGSVGKKRKGEEKRGRKRRKKGTLPPGEEGERPSLRVEKKGALSKKGTGNRRE